MNGTKELNTTSRGKKKALQLECFNNLFKVVAKLENEQYSFLCPLNIRKKIESGYFKA